MKSFELTASLRWNDGVLEQRWFCLEDGSEEWEPVPTKEEREEIEND